MQRLEQQDPVLGAQGGQVLPVAHDERGDTRLAGLGEGGAQEFVDLEVLLAARGDVVGAAEVDRLDPVQVHEVGDLEGAGASRRDLVEFLGLHDDVLALAHLVSLDDVVGADLLAGALVDPPVADPVRGAALQLVEVDRVVLGRREQTDGHRDQPEGDHARPDRPCHDRPLRPLRPSRPHRPVCHAAIRPTAPRAGRGTRVGGAATARETAAVVVPCEVCGTVDVSAARPSPRRTDASHRAEQRDAP
ncbi:hypothetical protein RKD42_007694 [Streptomyces ambofaciens]